MLPYLISILIPHFFHPLRIQSEQTNKDGREWYDEYLDDGHIP